LWEGGRLRHGVAAMPGRRGSPTDRPDAEWEPTQPSIPPGKPGGPAPPAGDRRWRTGCAWRLLPHDLPSRQTVDHDWRSRRVEGRWEPILAGLRERERQGRGPTPSAAILDRQSVTTPERGDMATTGARRGAKRHLLTDTGGVVVEALGTAAGRPRQTGGPSWPGPGGWPRRTSTCP